MKEIEPKCMNTEDRQKASLTIQKFASNNAGILLPCCWLDSEDNFSHPLLKALMKVSKITEATSIENILKTKEWKDFAIALSKGVAKDLPPACALLCKKRKSNPLTEIWIDEKGKETKKFL